MFKKCVYLCITAINFAEISASSGMFRHLELRFHRITKTENVKKLPKHQFYKLRRIVGIVYGAKQFASVIEYPDT